MVNKGGTIRRLLSTNSVDPDQTSPEDSGVHCMIVNKLNIINILTAADLFSEEKETKLNLAVTF